jgi:hypothetical protein
MGADEVGTLKGLTERRAILDRLIGEHRGRVAAAHLLANFETCDGGNFRTAGQRNMGPKLSPRVPEMLVILICRSRCPLRAQSDVVDARREMT